MSTMLSVYGAVNVNGLDYEDDEICDLVGHSLEQWSFIGDQDSEEEGIVVCSYDGIVSELFTDLPAAVDYINAAIERLS